MASSKVLAAESTLSSTGLPCPGLIAADEPLITQYLRHTTIPGGGSHSVVVIANELFHKTFGKLSKQRKQMVIDKQFQGHMWRNDHQQICVYSTQCEKIVKTMHPDIRIQACSRCRSLLTYDPFL